ncbi:hypothetical protein [Parasphingorhabdus sp.]|uniref:hypothetical protein n=1 Tax=Parasphingorhabdus sp. TaxID=2709688 RepID=UPI003A94B272
MPDMRMILTKATLIAAMLVAGLSASQAAQAAPLSASIQGAATDPRATVKIESKILLERTEPSASGEMVTKLLDPATIKVVPGDKLLFVNSYRNIGQNAVTGFVLNNPVHPAVALIEVVEDWAVVSVDGGQNFGKLSTLSVIEAVPATADGEASQRKRPALPSDVTHIRWTLTSAIEPGASGELHFRGIVK